MTDMRRIQIFCRMYIYNNSIAIFAYMRSVHHIAGWFLRYIVHQLTNRRVRDHLKLLGVGRYGPWHNTLTRHHHSVTPWI